MTPAGRDRRTYVLLVVGTAVNALGSGVYLPLSLLILSGMSGLSITAVGLTLTLAQFVAVAAMPLVGRALDHVGAKLVLVIAMAAQAVGFAVYPLLEHPVAFMAVTTLVAIGNQTGKTARPTVIAALSKDRARDRLLALNRSLANAGLGLGGLILAVSSAQDVGAYAVICWFNAATFVAAGVLTALLRLEHARPVETVPYRAFSVLRDAPYARFLGSTLCASLLYTALTVFIPLYVVGVLDQSTSVAGALFVINTFIAAVGGVPAVAVMHRLGMSRVQGANVGIVLLAAGIAALPLGTRLEGVWVTGFAVLAMVVYSVGELLHSPASAALSLGAAPAGQRGRYQAQYQMTMTLGAAIAPAAFTLLLSHRPAGGAAFAGLCGLLGVALMIGTPDTPDST